MIKHDISQNGGYINPNSFEFSLPTTSPDSKIIWNADSTGFIYKRDGDRIPSLANLAPYPFIREYMRQRNVEHYILINQHEQILVEEKPVDARVFQLQKDFSIIIPHPSTTNLVSNEIINGGRIYFTNAEMLMTLFLRRTFVRNIIHHHAIHSPELIDLVKELFTDDGEPRLTDNVVNKLIVSDILSDILSVVIEVVFQRAKIPQGQGQIPDVKPMPVRFMEFVKSQSLAKVWKFIGNSVVMQFMKFPLKQQIGIIRHVAHPETPLADIVYTCETFNYFSEIFRPNYDTLANIHNIYGIYKAVSSIEKTINTNMVTGLNKTLSKSLDQCYYEFMALLTELMYTCQVTYRLNLPLDIPAVIINLYFLASIGRTRLVFPVNYIGQIRSYFKQDVFPIESKPKVLETEKDKISYTLQKRLYQQQVHFQPVPYEFYLADGKSIPDCGETTVKNLINAIIWNVEEFDIDRDRLPDTTRPEVMAYYDTYQTVVSQLDLKAHQDWSQIVTRVDHIDYMRPLDLEVLPTKDNILKLTHYLLGQTFDQLMPDAKHQENTIILAVPEVTFTFSVNHADTQVASNNNIFDREQKETYFKYPEIRAVYELSYPFYPLKWEYLNYYIAYNAIHNSVDLYWHKLVSDDPMGHMTTLNAISPAIYRHIVNGTRLNDIYYIEDLIGQIDVIPALTYLLEFEKQHRDVIYQKLIYTDLFSTGMYDEIAQLLAQIKGADHQYNVIQIITLVGKYIPMTQSSILQALIKTDLVTADMLTVSSDEMNEYTKRQFKTIKRMYQKLTESSLQQNDQEEWTTLRKKKSSRF